MTIAVNLRDMTIDSLWQLYEDARSMLKTKMHQQKADLEKQLELLDRSNAGMPMRNSAMARSQVRRSKPAVRPYPKVYPRFRNPDDPRECWSGRGLQPRWLVAQIKAGKRLEEFRISNPETSH